MNAAGVVPSSTMRTSDGRWVIIGGNGDSVYTRLMAAVGHPEMGSDNPKFANNTARCEAQDEIYKVGIARVAVVLCGAWCVEEYAEPRLQTKKPLQASCILVWNACFGHLYAFLMYQIYAVGVDMQRATQIPLPGIAFQEIAAANLQSVTSGLDWHSPSDV